VADLAKEAVEAKPTILRRGDNFTTATAQGERGKSFASVFGFALFGFFLNRVTCIVKASLLHFPITCKVQVTRCK